jgi:hypothetical protein
MEEKLQSRRALDIKGHAVRNELEEYLNSPLESVAGSDVIRWWGVNLYLFCASECLLTISQRNSSRYPVLTVDPRSRRNAQVVNFHTVVLVIMSSELGIFALLPAQGRYHLVD